MRPDRLVGISISFYFNENFLFFLRSRPVAVMEATTAFETEMKLISLDDKACTLRDGSKVTCTTINSCLMYKGVNLPQYIGMRPNIHKIWSSY